jgi:hypothetical protein
MNYTGKLNQYLGLRICFVYLVLAILIISNPVGPRVPEFSISNSLNTNLCFHQIFNFAETASTHFNFACVLFRRNC